MQNAITIDSAASLSERSGCFLMPIPQRARKALRRDAAKEGISAADLARRLLAGKGSKQAAATGADSPAAPPLPSCMEVFLIIPASLFTSAELAGIDQAAAAKGITPEAFIKEVILANLTQTTNP